MADERQPRVRRIRTADLRASELAASRALMDAAFLADDDDGFTDEDWSHALGGTHFLLELDDALVGHASVVERDLHIGGVPFRTGYVEGVAVAPEHQAHGLGSILMEDVNAFIRETAPLGGLSTGRHRFYQRLGWETWLGPSSVWTAEGLHRTLDDDGDILILRTPATPNLDLTAPISCADRPGDAW